MPSPKEPLINWFEPDWLFDGESLRPGMAFQIAGHCIARVSRATDLPAGVAPQKLPGLVTPGYVDLQVNGGGGVLLNQTPTAQAMSDIAAAHRRFGTVALLPTVITDAPGVLAKSIEAAREAKDRPGIAGLHIEGPHISEARRGTHAAQYIRPMDVETIRGVERLRQAGIPVMITVAPEATSPRHIAELAEMGAVVSLGHSDASAEMTRVALSAGANCFTHLFNAMSPLINRAPGMTGAAINSNAYAGIICDGIHVADENIALAIRARPEPDRMFLVSDAMPTVGGPDHFDLYGDRLRLRDGRLVNSEGSLAGAHITMAQSVARLVTTLGISPEQALRMAITVPSQLMGLSDLRQIEGRALSDVLILDAKMNVVSTLHGAMRAAA